MLQWCDTCRTFKREYERCKGIAAAANLSVEFAMVNSEDEETLKDRYEINFYPSFKLFKDGMLEDIGSGTTPLTGEGVIAGLRQAMGLPATTFARQLSGLDETRDWLFYRGRADLSMKSALMGFFPPASASSPQYAAFNEIFESGAAALSGTIRFGRVTDPEVVELFNLPLDAPSLVLYKDYDEGKEVYTGEAEISSFVRWAVTRNKAIALPVDTHNLRQLQRDTPVIVHVFVNERGYEEAKSRAEYLNLMRSVGKDLEAEGLVTRGQIVFTLVNAEKHPHWMDTFGLDRKQIPGVGLADNKNKAFYGLPGVQGTLPTDAALPELNTPAILDFVQRYYSGLLAPVPPKNDA